MHVNDGESAHSDASTGLQFATHQFHNAINLLVALLQVCLQHTPQNMRLSTVIITKNN